MVLLDKGEDSVFLSQAAIFVIYISLFMDVKKVCVEEVKKRLNKLIYLGLF